MIICEVTHMTKKIQKSTHGLRASLVVAALLGAPMTASSGTMYFDFNANLSSTGSGYLYLFGDANVNANISNLSGYNQTVTLNADGFYSLQIPYSYAQIGTGTFTSGFEVASDDSIAGYFINRRDASTDMAYLLDDNALGRDYVIASHDSGYGEGSQVTIHATEDNTSVTLTPSVGGPVNVVLDAGETYKYVGGSSDLSGSMVSADKNVAVFSGHACANVPTSSTTYCDTLLEQMIPTDRLSTSYFVTSSEPADDGLVPHDFMKIIATADNTEITIDGVVVATLDAGEVYEFYLPGGTGSRIAATSPVMVAQYLIGGRGAATDPAMSLVVGEDNWLDSYRLSTPAGSAAFDNNYASVVIDTANLGSLMLDGLGVDTSSFSAITGTDFSRGLVDLSIGLFDLTADSPFLVMLGGGENVDSYLTYGGATFAPGISPVDPPSEPMPVPAPLALMGLGLLGLGLIRKAKAV